MSPSCVLVTPLDQIGCNVRFCAQLAAEVGTQSPLIPSDVEPMVGVRITIPYL